MKQYVTWSDVNNFVDNVINETKDRHFVGVYGLARGGLIPAVMLSHRLNIPLLASPCDGCLIVDDICDSGETLCHYINNSSGDKKHNYFVATIFYRHNDLVTPHYYMKDKYDNWIVFPWEE